MSEYHETVMPAEAVNGLHIKKLANYIDATLGNGGHALEILKQGGNVLGIDMDPEMIEIAQKRLRKACPAANQSVHGQSFKLVHGNFINIDSLAKENGWLPVSGILFDLGVSNVHLKDLERGFSFENPEANLDMRIDPSTQAVSAADLLNVLREDQLQSLFETTLDPGPAKWITGRVLHSKAKKPISTVGDMLEVCEGLKIGKKGINEATLPFLALRISVNSELLNLKEVLPKAFELLGTGGRLVVISFHSGEDRIAKDFFKQKEKEGSASLVTLKPEKASEEEVLANRRSRSAKMRVLEKK